MDNAEFEYDLFEIAAVKKYSEVFLTCDPIFSYQDARKKEKTVCELEQALEHLEWEYKYLQLNVYL